MLKFLFLRNLKKNKKVLLLLFSKKNVLLLLFSKCILIENVFEKWYLICSILSNLFLYFYIYNKEVLNNIYLMGIILLKYKWNNNKFFYGYILLYKLIKFIILKWK